MSLSGRLRHRVNIQQRTDSQDPVTGAITPTWATLYENVPADIEPLSVREFMKGKATQSEITTRITIRYRSGLDNTMRLLHGSDVYNPEGFLPDSRAGREYLTIPCSKGLNEGQ